MLEEASRYLHENATVFLLIVGVVAVAELGKIAKTLEAIRGMLSYEFHRRKDLP